jgi:hypothetical protein
VAHRLFSKGFASGLQKTAVFLFLVLLLFSFSEANEIWLGLQGGLSLPNFSGGTTELSKGYTSRRAPFIGLAVGFVLSPSFAIRTEINYSSQGGQRNGMQPLAPDQAQGLPIPPELTLYANFDNETIIDYLEIPLMAEFSSGRRVKFFANAGPYVGYRVRAKTVTSGMSTLYIDSSGNPLIIYGQALPPVSFDAETDVSGEINRLNLGLCASLGAKIPFGPGLFALSARFSLGLSNIQSHPEITGRNRTGAFIVGVSYFCRLK